MKRSCQRQTQVFDLPVRRMISLVPTASALNRTISARQTCLCGALRSRASTFRRRRSASLRVMEIPVRMRQTRMRPVRGESPPGFKCQTQSTSGRECDRSIGFSNQQNLEITFGREVLLADLERSGGYLLHVVEAKADEPVRQ